MSDKKRSLSVSSTGKSSILPRSSENARFRRKLYRKKSSSFQNVRNSSSSSTYEAYTSRVNLTPRSSARRRRPKAKSVSESLLSQSSPTLSTLAASSTLTSSVSKPSKLYQNASLEMTPRLEDFSSACLQAKPAPSSVFLFEQSNRKRSIASSEQQSTETGTSTGLPNCVATSTTGLDRHIREEETNKLRLLNSNLDMLGKSNDRTTIKGAVSDDVIGKERKLGVRTNVKKITSPLLQHDRKSHIGILEQKPEVKKPKISDEELMRKTLRSKSDNLLTRKDGRDSNAFGMHILPKLQSEHQYAGRDIVSQFKPDAVREKTSLDNLIGPLDLLDDSDPLRRYITTVGHEVVIDDHIVLVGKLNNEDGTYDKAVILGKLQKRKLPENLANRNGRFGSGDDSLMSLPSMVVEKAQELFLDPNEVQIQRSLAGQMNQRLRRMSGAVTSLRKRVVVKMRERFARKRRISEQEMFSMTNMPVVEEEDFMEEIVSFHSSDDPSLDLSRVMGSTKPLFIGSGRQVASPQKGARGRFMMRIPSDNLNPLRARKLLAEKLRVLRIDMGQDIGENLAKWRRRDVEFPVGKRQINRNELTLEHLMDKKKTGEEMRHMKERMRLLKTASLYGKAPPSSYGSYLRDFSATNSNCSRNYTFYRNLANVIRGWVEVGSTRRGIGEKRNVFYGGREHVYDEVMDVSSFETTEVDKTVSKESTQDQEQIYDKVPSELSKPKTYDTVASNSLKPVSETNKNSQNNLETESLPNTLKQDSNPGSKEDSTEIFESFHSENETSGSFAMALQPSVGFKRKDGKQPNLKNYIRIGKRRDTRKQNVKKIDACGDLAPRCVTFSLPLVTDRDETKTKPANQVTTDACRRCYTEPVTFVERLSKTKGGKDAAYWKSKRQSTSLPIYERESYAEKGKTLPRSLSVQSNIEKAQASPQRNFHQSKKILKNPKLFKRGSRTLVTIGRRSRDSKNLAVVPGIATGPSSVPSRTSRGGYDDVYGYDEVASEYDSTDDATTAERETGTNTTTNSTSMWSGTDATASKETTSAGNKSTVRTDEDTTGGSSSSARIGHLANFFDEALTPVSDTFKMPKENPHSDETPVKAKGQNPTDTSSTIEVRSSQRLSSFVPSSLDVFGNKVQQKAKFPDGLLKMGGMDYSSTNVSQLTTWFDRSTKTELTSKISSSSCDEIETKDTEKRNNKKSVFNEKATMMYLRGDGIVLRSLQVQDRDTVANYSARAAGAGAIGHHEIPMRLKYTDSQKQNILAVCNAGQCFDINCDEHKQPNTSTKPTYDPPSYNQVTLLDVKDLVKTRNKDVYDPDNDTRPPNSMCRKCPLRRETFKPFFPELYAERALKPFASRVVDFALYEGRNTYTRHFPKYTEEEVENKCDDFSFQALLLGTGRFLTEDAIRSSHLDVRSELFYERFMLEEIFNVAEEFGAMSFSQRCIRDARRLCIIENYIKKHSVPPVTGMLAATSVQQIRTLDSGSSETKRKQPYSAQNSSYDEDVAFIVYKMVCQVSISDELVKKGLATCVDRRRFVLSSLSVGKLLSERNENSDAEANSSSESSVSAASQISSRNTSSAGSSSNFPPSSGGEERRTSESDIDQVAVTPSTSSAEYSDEELPTPPQSSRRAPSDTNVQRKSKISRIRKMFSHESKRKRSATNVKLPKRKLPKSIKCFFQKLLLYGKGKKKSVKFDENYLEKWKSSTSSVSSADDSEYYLLQLEERSSPDSSLSDTESSDEVNENNLTDPQSSVSSLQSLRQEVTNNDPDLEDLVPNSRLENLSMISTHEDTYENYETVFRHTCPEDENSESTLPRPSAGTIYTKPVTETRPVKLTGCKVFGSVPESLLKKFGNITRNTSIYDEEPGRAFFDNLENVSFLRESARSGGSVPQCTRSESSESESQTDAEVNGLSLLSVNYGSDSKDDKTAASESSALESDLRTSAQVPGVAAHAEPLEQEACCSYTSQHNQAQRELSPSNSFNSSVSPGVSSSTNHPSDHTSSIHSNTRELVHENVANCYESESQISIRRYSVVGQDWENRVVDAESSDKKIVLGTRGCRERDSRSPDLVTIGQRIGKKLLSRGAVKTRPTVNVDASTSAHLFVQEMLDEADGSELINHRSKTKNDLTPEGTRPCHSNRNSSVQCNYNPEDPQEVTIQCIDQISDRKDEFIKDQDVVEKRTGSVKAAHKLAEVDTTSDGTNLKSVNSIKIDRNTSSDFKFNTEIVKLEINKSTDESCYSGGVKNLVKELNAELQRVVSWAKEVGFATTECSSASESDNAEGKKFRSEVCQSLSEIKNSLSHYENMLHEAKPNEGDDAPLLRQESSEIQQKLLEVVNQLRNDLVSQPKINDRESSEVIGQAKWRKEFSTFDDVPSEQQNIVPSVSMGDKRACGANKGSSQVPCHSMCSNENHPDATSCTRCVCRNRNNNIQKMCDHCSRQKTWNLYNKRFHPYLRHNHQAEKHPVLKGERSESYFGSTQNECDPLYLPSVKSFDVDQTRKLKTRKKSGEKIARKNTAFYPSGRSSKAIKWCKDVRGKRTLSKRQKNFLKNTKKVPDDSDEMSNNVGFGSEMKVLPEVDAEPCTSKCTNTRHRHQIPKSGHERLDENYNLPLFSPRPITAKQLENQRPHESASERSLINSSCRGEIVVSPRTVKYETAHARRKQENESVQLTVPVLKEYFEDISCKDSSEVGGGNTQIMEAKTAPDRSLHDESDASIVSTGRKSRGSNAVKVGRNVAYPNPSSRTKEKTKILVQRGTRSDTTTESYSETSMSPDNDFDLTKGKDKRGKQRMEKETWRGNRIDDPVPLTSNFSSSQCYDAAYHDNFATDSVIKVGRRRMPNISSDFIKKIPNDRMQQRIGTRGQSTTKKSPAINFNSESESGFCQKSVKPDNVKPKWAQKLQKWKSQVGSSADDSAVLSRREKIQAKKARNMTCPPDHCRRHIRDHDTFCDGQQLRTRCRNVKTPVRIRFGDRKDHQRDIGKNRHFSQSSDEGSGGDSQNVVNYLTGLPLRNKPNQCECKESSKPLPRIKTVHREFSPEKETCPYKEDCCVCANHRSCHQHRRDIKDSPTPSSTSIFPIPNKDSISRAWRGLCQSTSDTSSANSPSSLRLANSTTRFAAHAVTSLADIAARVVAVAALLYFVVGEDVFHLEGQPPT